MAFIYAEAVKSIDFFPLWEVRLRKNWNLGDTPQQLGNFQTIRLCHTETAATLLVKGLNALLELLELINDVPE